MTVEIVVVLVMLVAATALFALEWLSVDLVALLVIAGLVVTRILTPEEALSGFANEVIVILASVLVISGAMVRAGVMEWFGRLLFRASGKRKQLVGGYLMGVAAAVSAFFSNTSATAILMPAAFELSRKSKMSPSRLLMPLAYASILGGTCTLIGTSTNLASSGLVARLGLEPYSLFEFTGIGVLLAAVGIGYLAIVGYRLVPVRAASLAEDYRIHEYLSRLAVPEGSPLAGKALRELKFSENDVSVLKIIRGDETLTPGAGRKLRAGDKLIVKGPKDALLRAAANHDVEIDVDASLSDEDLKIEGAVLGEAVIMPQSRFIGRTIRQLELRRRFGVSVVAVFRRGHAQPTRIAPMRLRIGDVLLIQGSKEDLQRLRGNPNLWGLAETESRPLSMRQGVFALSVLVAAVILGTTGIIPLSIALLLAAVSLVLARITTMEEAYGFIEWRLLVLIAGMTSFGVAMQKTGAAGYLAELMVSATVPFGIYATLAAFAVLTVLLTQPMSNAAAALVVLPVAVATADILGVNPRSLAILVTISASLSFITPLEPASLLVYGPGKYRFRDYIRAGAPLTVIVITLLVILLPWFWPL